MKIKTSFENRPDSSEWRRYTTSTGVEVVVTSAFRDVMKNGEAKITGNCDVVGKLFLKLLHRYRKYYEEKCYGEVRKHIASGQEAQFYGVDTSNI